MLYLKGCEKMAKANAKYPNTSTTESRQKAFDERREHQHFPQGKTGYNPRTARLN